MVTRQTMASETPQRHSSVVRSALGVGLAAIGTVGLLALTLTIGQQTAEDLGRYVLYQAAGLAIAVLVVAGVVPLTGRRPVYLRWGRRRATAAPITVLGVKPTVRPAVSVSALRAASP